MLQERGQFLELIAFASIDEKRGAREAAFAGGVELGKNRNQFDGKIIDAIKAHVLEGVQDGAFSGAGQAGEDDELAGFGMMRVKRGGLSECLCLPEARRGLSFSPGADAYWECACLRDIWPRCGA